jgi:uncharacterized membrane protein
VLLDGGFRVVAWVATVAGVALVMVARRRPTPRAALGLALIGWGSFNLVEGIVDHHVLGLHHVRPGPDALLWDLGFLVWGAAMVAVGWWLSRSMFANPAAQAR